jgi:hypothetical protein
MATSHVCEVLRQVLDGMRRIEERIDGLPAESREIQGLTLRVKELESLLSARERRGSGPSALPRAPGAPVDAGEPGR